MSSTVLEKLSEHSTARAFDEAASLGRPCGAVSSSSNEQRVSPICDEPLKHPGRWAFQGRPRTRSAGHGNPSWPWKKVRAAVGRQIFAHQTHRPDRPYQRNASPCKRKIPAGSPARTGDQWFEQRRRGSLERPVSDLAENGLVI